MDIQPQKQLELNNIPDNILLQFQMMITPPKIFNFFEQSMAINEKSKTKDYHKLNKSDFISICNSVFSKELKDNIFINTIYGLIFERLKERKCLFKMNKPFSSRHYALADIISTEKIEIQNAQMLFSALMMTNFKTKVETMFHIIDTDSDGLISEEELKRLIIITNRLFYEESKEKFSKSSLIQQSMSNFRGNKALSKLLYGAADLKNLLDKSKFISFDEFYERLKRVDNYMYEIIPTFINLKHYLNNKKEEIVYYMNNNCKKDFVEISYDLINKNKIFNSLSQKNMMKQMFDKRKKLKQIKLDSLKDLNKRKEKQKEMKLQKSSNSNKTVLGNPYNQLLRLSLKKHNLSASNIKFNHLSPENILNEKEFNYNTPSIKTISSNPTNKEEEKYNYSNTNNMNKKIKTAEFQEKLLLYSDKESEKSNEKKYPNSFPLLRKTRRKTILNKIFGIPMEVSPFEITEKNTKEKNKIENDNKIVNISENAKQNLITTKINTASDNNLDTNFSTLAIPSPVLSSKNNNFLNFKKISIFNNKKNDKIKGKSPINNTYFRKGKRLIEPISPRYSLINKTTSRKLIPYILSIYSDLNKKKSECFEQADYTKFNSILFPPCIIRTKEKGTSENSFLYTKDGFMNKKKTARKKRFSGIDFSRTLLNTHDEMKNEVLEELEQQRNSDINGISAILRVKRSINEKMNKFDFFDINAKKVSFKNFFIVAPEKMKKYL